MARHDRGGAYEPQDEVRVYDGAEDEDEDIEGSRLPLLIVLALLVLGAFGSVVYLAYSQGVVRGQSQPRILTAETTPARVAPATADRDGGETATMGLKIYEQPAPTNPDSDPGEAQTRQEAQTPAPVTPAPAPVQTAPVQTAQAQPQPSVQAAPARPVPATPAARPPVTSAPPPVANRIAPPAPVSTAPGIATGAPRTLGTPAPSRPAPAAAASAPAPAPVQAAAAAGGAWLLQVGAFKSEAEANGAWQTYRGRHAALLSGYGPNVARVDLGDKGVWYRLRVGSFGDRDVASSLCDRLKADAGNCFLVH